MPPGVIQEAQRREEVDTASLLRALLKIELTMADVDVLAISQEDIVQEAPYITPPLAGLFSIGAGRVDNRA